MRSRGDDRSPEAKLVSAAYAHDGATAGGGAFAGQGPVAWTRARFPDAAALMWLAPLGLAAAYVAMFVVQLPRNLTELAWNADYASGFTVPESLARTGPGGHIVMGSAAEWVPLWFGLLTARLPLHRPLWEIIPTLLFVAATLTIGWSVSRLAGRRAGVLAVLLGFVISPLALSFLMAPVAHNLVWPCTALVGAYLIWLAKGEGRRRWLTIAAPPLLGVVVGLCLASDVLLAATAVIPLGLVAVLAGVRRDRRCRIVALCCLVPIVIALPIAKEIPAIMAPLGYIKERTPATVVPLSELPARAELLFKGLKMLFGGYLGEPGRTGALHAPLGAASVVAMSAALLALLIFGVLTGVRFLFTGLRRGARMEPVELARSMHVVYWVSSAAATCGAFWLAAETGGGTNLHESYYGNVIFSVAAVIPLLLARGALARVAIAVGASVLFAAGIAGLASNYMNISGWIAKYAPSVERIARANHVQVGYGGYGEGSSLTWNSHGRVTVRPVMECENPGGPGICPFYLVAVPSWYVPRERHTFLLVDREEFWVHQLPRDLGKPLAAYNFGAMQMYIYPYDIASRLGPQPG